MPDATDIVPVAPEGHAVTVHQPTAGLDVYDKISDPMAAVKQLGKSIFASGLFKLDRPEQGEVLAMECLKQRMSPLELSRTYHYFNGQLSMKAEAKLAKFQQAGGEVDWIERTNEVVEAEFIRNGRKVRIRSTMAEYLNTDTPWTTDKTGKKVLKDNWAQRPRRMLTARTISEGVALLAPDVFFGIPTSEEEIDEGQARRFQRASADYPSAAEEYNTEQLAAAVEAVLKDSGDVPKDASWEAVADYINAMPVRARKSLRAFVK